MQHGDACRLGNSHVLAGRAHILPQLGAAEPEDEQAERADDGKRRQGDLDARDLAADKIVKTAPERVKIERVADAVAAREQQLRAGDRHNGAESIEDDELIHAVHEEAEDVRRDHLAPAGLVQHHAADPAEDDRQRRGDDRSQNESVQPHDVPVADEDQTDLPRHRAEHHAEVQPHAGHDRHEQRKHEERVARQAHEHLLDQIIRRELRKRDRRGTDEDKDDRHGVPDQEHLEIFRAVHHDLPFVARVRA